MPRTRTGSHFGMIRRGDAPVGTAVGAVDPVVARETGVRDARFVVYFWESCVQDLPNVSLAIAIFVLHEQNVRRAGDNQAALPWHEPADRKDLIREDRGTVDLAIAVRVLQQTDT